MGHKLRNNKALYLGILKNEVKPNSVQRYLQLKGHNIVNCGH